MWLPRAVPWPLEGSRLSVPQKRPCACPYARPGDGQTPRWGFAHLQAVEMGRGFAHLHGNDGPWGLPSTLEPPGAVCSHVLSSRPLLGHTPRGPLLCSEDTLMDELSLTPLAFAQKRMQGQIVAQQVNMGSCPGTVDWRL